MVQKMQLAREAEQAEMAKEAGGNKAKGKEFLALLSKQEGVKKILQVSIMKFFSKAKAPVRP